MQSEQQQRIMGYFMEEAQDHLNTIEQGLLNLQSTIEDPETLNEMFRAAHSVKGGAAMLGLNSIHQTAHRLEDYFKVLQETPIQVDTQLETLLLRVFDSLSALLNQLQSYGLTDETASTIMSEAEPVFEQLNSYLQQLAQNTQTAGDTPSPANSSQSSSKGTKTLPATFKRDVLVELREMLQLYKQSDTPEHRHALQDHCQRLIELGDRLDLPGWGELLEISKRAIANPENSYRLLASVTIKEIKQAQELVLTGRSAEIVPSEQLKALAPDATTVESTTASDSSTYFSPQPTSATEESNQNQKETSHLPDSRDTYIQAEDTYIQDSNGTSGFRRDQLRFSTVQSSNSISPLSDQGEPEVGIAELNSLADIFETQTPDLDQTWQEEEDVINLNDKSLNSDSDDFLDLEDSNDFSDLIGESEQENSTADDLLMQGLDDDFAPDAIANPQASKESSDSLDISSSLTDDFSDLLFESDSSEDSDQMSHSDDDLNGLFGESFFDEEGEASSAEILSHSELEDLDVEENFPQPSLQGDETVSESDFDFDDLLEISSTEENPRTLGESVNQDDLDLEDYLESNDLDLENQLDNNNQAETIDIESATPEAGDVLNPFEETSLDDFDQEAWEDSEDLPDFEALDDFFDSEPGVESTPVDSLTEPENDSIVELPTSTDEALLNETTTSAQKDGDSSESLFEEQGDEILPEVTEDVSEFFAEEGQESQGSTAQVEDFDIDWSTDESQGTQQPWTSETESAADLFGDWETPQAPSNEDLDDLFAEDGEESFDSSAPVEDLEADWLTDESQQIEQPETLDTSADLFGDWETPETPSSEDLDDLFGEQQEEEALAESAEPDDLEADWLTDESQQTPQPETSDTQADIWGEWETPETEGSEDLDDLFGEQEEEALAESVEPEDLKADWLTDESPEIEQPETSDTTADIFGDWETPETPSSEDLDDLFGEQEEEALAESAEPEDLEADWFTDESPEIEQPETSDTQTDIWGEWETPETAPSEDLDDLFAEDEAEAAPSAELEGLDEDWLTDESPETSQPETSNSAADLFGDEEILETAPSEDLDDLFAEEEAEAAPSAELEGLDEDWLIDESVETPQPETSDSAADLFGDEEILETEGSEDLDDLFAEEEAEVAPSAELKGLDEDWLTDESPEIEQPETSDTAADLFGDEDILETEGSEDLDNLFAEEEAEAAPSAELEGLDEDWLTDESVETPQPETSDSAADLFGDWDIPETEGSEDLDDLFAEEEAEAAPSAELEGLDEDWLTDESVETPQPETSDSAADLFGDWDIPETPSDEDLDELFSLEEATVDDDFSLATLAETEWDLDSPRESADEFADLETMLDGETSAALTSESGDEFADLETMLDGETSVALTSESGDEFADLEAMLSDTPSQTDSFEDLESFLEEPGATQDNRASVAQTPPSQDQDDLDKELEALLQDADKSIVGPATTTNTGSRQSASLSSRRPPRIFEQTMRVPVKHLDSLNNLVGELVVSRNSLEQDQERLRQFLDNLQHQVSALSDVGARMRDLYERSLLESSLLASSQSQQRSHSLFGSENAAPASKESDSESSEDYHPLEMDRFTGFHLLSQEMIELIVQVRESASDVEFLVDETDQVARNLRQVTTQLQEGLTRSRMVPFANAADRLTRPVREISIKLSKEAQLQVDGRETLLDKMILEHLYDPLTHLVNNAITHGIESPDERQEMGKPAVGQITLRAFHQGNQTVIAISDDGAGIDPERIKRKAIEKKLISQAEAKDLTNTELYDFLFHPGFSTKDEASEFAGRGVGMDVVRTSLSEIRGAIYIDSALGKGTTFTIRLPLTLSICKALCCLSDRARIAFPMDGVEDMFDVPQDRLQKDANGQVGVSWRDTLVSVQPLSELLSYNRSISRGNVYGGKREDDLVSIVVLRSSGTFIAIEVDQVLGEQEIVIKQLEGPPPKPIGIAGATVLGDGRIMPIADVLELIDLASGRLRKDSVTIWSRGDSEGAGIEEAPETPHEPLVLIVDDSITVRELLSMTFAKAGYRVEQSRDGQEAWDKLRSGLPCDIVFCDIEMPRMDGLELLSRLQKDENLSQLPIAMLTSRGAKRHRQMAAQLGASGYFTKPYLEEVLLDAAQRMIQGEVLFSASEA
ncbi:response regulator [Coleofasciculus sp. E1-EBD-02]|uniref:response regulator n=1 Tax=Coleofasciculus sp. E1-EBD-02 TaxID=3068481 RepID=UPI0040642615